MATSKKQDSPLASLLTELRTLTERISIAEAGEDPRAIKKLRLGLEQVTAQLKNVTHLLGPEPRPESIFDPNDPNTSGRVVALTLVAQSRHPLAKIPAFYGAGVYAIYYCGNFEPYAPLRGMDHPIYVGKADPDNQAAKDAVSQGTKLSARRNEHAKSIRSAGTTLDINDFDCRFLIVQTGFQKSAEDYLINFFKRSGIRKRRYASAWASTATVRKTGSTSVRRGTPCIPAASGPTPPWTIKRRRKRSSNR